MGKLGRQYFHRHNSVQAGVFGAVNLAHAASPGSGNYLVGPEASSCSDRHEDYPNCSPTQRRWGGYLLLKGLTAVVLTEPTNFRMVGKLEVKSQESLPVIQARRRVIFSVQR